MTNNPSADNVGHLLMRKKFPKNLQELMMAIILRKDYLQGQILKFKNF